MSESEQAFLKEARKLNPSQLNISQYKEILPYFVSFINDINEDITEGSDRE